MGILITQLIGAFLIWAAVNHNRGDNKLTTLSKDWWIALLLICIGMTLYNIENFFK